MISAEPRITMASPILDPKDGRVEDLWILEAEPHITLVGESGGHPSWIASSIGS